MEWHFKDGFPIYSQIVDQMKIRIASGTFDPGQKLPSVRDLAIDAGVNPNTMQKALAELERENLVYAVRTSGRFITEEASILEQLKQTLGIGYIKELFENLEHLGMTRQEIINAVTNYRKED